MSDAKEPSGFMEAAFGSGVGSPSLQCSCGQEHRCYGIEVSAEACALVAEFENAIFDCAEFDSSVDDGDYGEVSNRATYHGAALAQFIERLERRVPAEPLPALPDRLEGQCQALWRTSVSLLCTLSKDHDGDHRADCGYTFNGEVDVKAAQRPMSRDLERLAHMDRIIASGGNIHIIYSELRRIVSAAHSGETT